MDGFIDNHLKELTAILAEIIEFVKSKNLINEKNQDLFDLISNLYNQLKNKEIDVLKYDFRDLRKKVNKLIHPDLNPEFKEEANNVVTKINANIDNVIEFQKSMIQKGISNYSWKNTENETRFKYAFDEKPVDRYKTYYSGDLSKDADPIYGCNTVGDDIREMWNYIVNKVPRGSKDYFKIKKSYEKLIQKLKEKIQNKNAVLKNYENELKELKNEFALNLREENINEIFEEEKELKTMEHSGIVDKYELESKKLEKIKEPLTPIVNKIVREKCKMMEILYSEYKKVSAEVNQNPSLLQMNYPGSKRTYFETLKSYEQELNDYPNSKVIYQKISNDIYSKNHDYLNISKKIKSIEDEARVVYDKMMRYYDNPEVMKLIIKERITNEYNHYIRVMETKRKLTTKKKEKLEIKLERVEGTYAKFLLNYEATYEQPMGRSRR